MRFRNKIAIIITGMLCVVYGVYLFATQVNLNLGRDVGEIVDGLDGVAVY
jgi:hypothetical protein